MKRSLLLLACLLVPCSAWAVCSGSSPSWTAASCSAADIQACIDGATVQAGDTINIPAGTCALASNITMSKNVTLKGAGNNVNGTILSAKAIAISAVASAGKYPVISDIRFNCQGAGLTGVIHVTSNTTQFRVTNNTFLGSTGSSDRCVATAANAEGRPYGVIDNNTFTGTNPFSAILVRADQEYTGRTLGDASAVYIENNTMTATAIGDGVVYVDGDYGSHIVIRYNTITNGGGITLHGGGDADPSSREPTITWEIYNNVLNANAGHRYWNIHLRGGTGVIYKNATIVSPGSDISRGLSFQDYRSSITASGSGACDSATNGCDGNHAWDGNTVYASGTSGTGGSTTVMYTTGLTASAHVGRRLYQGANSCRISANTATSVTCAEAMEGGVDWSAATAYEIKTGWPCFGQVGTKPGTTYGTAGHLMDAAPAYVWGNTCSGTVSYGCSGGVLTPTPTAPSGTCRVTAAAIAVNRDYYLTTHPTYTAYTCPHPLVGAGTCDSGVAGRDAYVVTTGGTGGTLTLGGSGSLTPGEGGTITVGP